MAGSASKERSGRKMSMVVAKDKAIRGPRRARIWRDDRGWWSRQLPSCPTLFSYGCSSLLLTSPSMSPCTISCYIPTILASHTTSLVDSGNSPSTSFGRSGVSYGEHKRSLQNTFELVFDTPSQPSACLQAISIPGTRVLCHGLFTQVHSRSHACV